MFDGLALRWTRGECLSGNDLARQGTQRAVSEHAFPCCGNGGSRFVRRCIVRSAIREHLHQARLKLQGERYCCGPVLLPASRLPRALYLGRGGPFQGRSLSWQPAAIFDQVDRGRGGSISVGLLSAAPQRTCEPRSAETPSGLPSGPGTSKLQGDVRPGTGLECRPNRHRIARRGFDLCRNL